MSLLILFLGMAFIFFGLAMFLRSRRLSPKWTVATTRQRKVILALDMAHYTLKMIVMGVLVADLLVPLGLTFFWFTVILVGVTHLLMVWFKVR